DGPPGGQAYDQRRRDLQGRGYAAHIDKACEKALAAAELPTDWNGLVDRMRDCLLAKELAVGEAVLFAATEPYGGSGDFDLRGGVIQTIDPERGICTIRGEFFPMDDVPLHYVLG